MWDMGRAGGLAGVCHDLAMLHVLAAGVWWFPPLVLQTAAFALSFCLGVLIYVISYYAWHSQDNAQAVWPRSHMRQPGACFMGRASPFAPGR